MATPKSWTASDIRQGKLIIIRNGTELHIERRYQFEDNLGDVMAKIAGGRVVEDIEWSDIPSSIQDALAAIDVWTYDQALSQEGMT